MSLRVPDDGFHAPRKIVVDHGGELNFVRHDAEPGVGGYPDGWMDLDDLLDNIEDDIVKLLLEGILQKQIDTDERLENI